MVKKILRNIYLILYILGFNPLQTFNFFRGISFYIKDFFKLRKQKGSNTEFKFDFPYPILGEKFTEAGVMSGHYFYQDLLVAQKIFKNNPQKHVDIGSRIDGFVSNVASFREIEVLDIRPQKGRAKNIIFKQADLIELPRGMVDYCDSLSSLHAIEHFGLGRYGDPVDYNGHKKGLDNMYKILKSGGKFYFSTPIGPQRIVFNANRVFEMQYLLDLFEGKFKVDSFSYVNDEDELFTDVDLDPMKIENNFGCEYGCGIFELAKI